MTKFWTELLALTKADKIYRWLFKTKVFKGHSIYETDYVFIGTEKEAQKKTKEIIKNCSSSDLVFKYEYEDVES